MLPLPPELPAVAAVVAPVAFVALILVGGILALQSKRLAVAGADAGGAKGAQPIPSPFPWYSDMALGIVTPTKGFPDSVALHARHGPLFWWRLLGRRVLMVGGYEPAMQLLKGEYTTVEADYPPSVRALLGRWGISNIYGKEHARIKRLLQAAFTPRALRGYLPRMQASAQAAVRKWAGQGEMQAYDEMKWWTFRVAVEIIVGFDNSWTSPAGFPVVNQLFRDWLAGLFSVPLAIPGTVFARGLKARKALMRHVHASLDALEAAAAAPAGPQDGAVAGVDGGAAGQGSNGEGKPAAQRSALDLLLSARDEKGRGLTRDQIADNVLTLLFAGHDTSATSLTRALQHLAAHPEAAARLHQEQVEVVAKHGPAITEEALADMPFTDGVVREALRITPIIAGFPRVALQDFELCGHTIKKGTRLQASLAQPLLTDSRWAGEADPLAFRPERWGGGVAAKAGAWIPFGGGPRLCLGWLLAMAEMKILLACLFRTHRLERLQPDEPWILFPLARPQNGMPCRVVPWDAE